MMFFDPLDLLRGPHNQLDLSALEELARQAAMAGGAGPAAGAHTVCGPLGLAYIPDPPQAAATTSFAGARVDRKGASSTFVLASNGQLVAVDFADPNGASASNFAFDTGNFWSANDLTKLTFSKNGYYMIGAGVVWPGSGTGTFQAQVWSNRENISAFDPPVDYFTTTSGTVSRWISMSALAPFFAGDWVQLQLAQSYSSPSVGFSSLDNSVTLWAWKVG